MIHRNKRIAVLLDGPIASDGRVRRVVESISEHAIVDLFCHSDSPSVFNLFGDNVSVFQCQKSSSWLHINLFMNKKFEDLKTKVLLQKDKYDFIYCNDYPLLNTAVEIKNHFNAKLIYDSHEIYIETINQFFPKVGVKKIYGIPLIAINKFYHSRIEKKMVREVDHFITVCQSFATYFSKKFKLENILIVKNCPKEIDFKKSKSLLRELVGLDKEDFILLYQGDINISRGIEKICQAITDIDKKVHFVVLGAGSKYNEFKKRYGNERIHFLGKVKFEELYSFTSSADLGIMLIESYNLSKKLTLPNKVFEYMVAEIPFVTNKLPEASAIAIEEGCGFVIDDTTSGKIALEINNIVNQANIHLKGEKGRKAIEMKYHWSKEVEKLISLFNVKNLHDSRL